MQKIIFAVTKILLLLLIYNFAMALSISPTMLTLSDKEPIAILQLTNDSDTSKIIQISVKAWQQRGETSHFFATEDMLVTPPLIQLPAYKTQIIRIASIKPPDVKVERNYRLFIQEVISEKITAHNGNELNISLRLSIPVFVLPQMPLDPAWLWQVKRLSKNQLEVNFTNIGNNTLFISQLRLLHNGKTFVTHNLNTFAYIQPQQKYRWYLKAKNSYEVTAVEATVNHQNVISNVHNIT